ncbi:phosphotransferase [Micromonospora sp. b486]|nr:phosphotransferase [Micromonospora sp. b486]MDM4777879.1 phosphotransferase [Micromonospora sp. b486]
MLRSVSRPSGRRAGVTPSEGAGPEPAAESVPLATGRTADVWLLPGGRVLRRYRDGGDVRAEAEVMRYLHRAGYPVPRVHHADGADLVLDRVTGPTLVEAFHAGTVTAPAVARILADLHARCTRSRPSGRPIRRSVSCTSTCIRTTCYWRRTARWSSTGPTAPRARRRWTGRRPR